MFSTGICLMCFRFFEVWSLYKVYTYLTDNTYFWWMLHARIGLLGLGHSNITKSVPIGVQVCGLTVIGLKQTALLLFGKNSLGFRYSLSTIPCQIVI